MDPLAWQLALDPPRSTTREERARRRAEEAAERENRALEREQREMTSAGVRHRDFTVRVREGFVTSCQGGIGGSRLGTRRRCNLGTRNREAGVTQNQEEVDVLEMVVADGDQAVEEIREAEEEDEGVIDEVGPGDLADREVVELDEDEAEAVVQIARVRSIREASVRIEEVEELIEDEAYVVINDNFVVDEEEEDQGEVGREDWVDQVGLDDMEELADDMVQQVDDMVEHLDDMEEHLDDMVEQVDDMVDQVDDMVEQDDEMLDQINDMVEQVDDLEEQLRELGEQDEDNLVEQAEDDLMLLVEAQDDDPDGAQDAEAAQGVNAEVGDVDGNADPPLSDTIDLTDSPRPTSRPLDPLQCPVCLDLLRSLPEWKEVVTTPCGHLFCSTCLATALRSVWQCPTCRGRTQPGEAIKIFL